MALAVRPPVFCNLKSSTQKSTQLQRPEPQIQNLPVVNSTPNDTGGGKIVLQPRLCTLRSYGSDRAGVIKTKINGSDGFEDGDVSRFFATLSEYVENSKKSQDFEVISGRLAMLVFAGTIIMEVVTGNSTFRKMEIKDIAEVGGVCIAAVTCAATFAWFSSARNRVGRIFTLGCNSFIDSIIDQIIDGIFYDTEDWWDDI